MGEQRLVDAMYNDGMVDAFYNILMGVTAENIAEMYKIPREEQDEFALMSHHRACASINNKTQASELIPVEIKTKKGTTLFDTDEHPRQGLTMADLAKLKPVFVKDGTVTAGNSSGINDGAAALVMMSLDKAKEPRREAACPYRGHRLGCRRCEDHGHGRRALGEKGPPFREPQAGRYRLLGDQRGLRRSDHRVQPGVEDPSR